MSTTEKLVVLQNGRRVSKTVHTTRESAEKEKEQHVKILQESKQEAAASSVIVTNLLLG